MTKKRRTGRNVSAVAQNRPPTTRSSSDTVNSQVSASHMSLRAQAELFEGPLPPPRLLAAYRDIQEDLVDRIVGMAERQSDHRQRMESRALDHDISRSKQGLYAGVWIGTLLLILSFVLIYTGHPVGGSIFGGTVGTALVATFLYEAHQRRQERHKKMQVLAGQEPPPAPANRLPPPR